MDELALAVRERRPPCALIMLSGHGRPEAGGGRCFLAKPLVFGTLLQTLGDLGVGPPRGGLR